MVGTPEPEAGPVYQASEGSSGEAAAAAAGGGTGAFRRQVSDRLYRLEQHDPVYVLTAQRLVISLIGCL